MSNKSKFCIEVDLNEELSKVALKHFEDERVRNMVADIQGTVKGFFETLAIEEVEPVETVADEENEKENKEEELWLMTPVGLICL